MSSEEAKSRELLEGMYPHLLLYQFLIVSVSFYLLLWSWH